MGGQMPQQPPQPLLQHPPPPPPQQQQQLAGGQGSGHGPIKGILRKREGGVNAGNGGGLRVVNE